MPQRLIRRDLEAVIVSHTGCERAVARAIVRESLALIRDTVAAGGKLTLSGFGTFTATTRRARRVINPRTGEEMRIPSVRRPVFRPSDAWVLPEEPDVKEDNCP
jgi:DNA-binding protein HU-beta